MAGYAGRKKPAEGRVQSLFAKALAIEDEASNTVVFVTLDLIGVPQSIRRTIAERLERELMIPSANLVMNASHTHSGPSLRTLPPAQPKDEAIQTTGALQNFEYTQKLEQDIFAVIAQALTSKEAARLTWNKARCGFAMNRRRDYSLPAGHPNANLAPNPDGPVDHEVPALRIEAPDGSLKAVLSGYACHNTCLGFYNFCGRQSARVAIWSSPWSELGFDAQGIHIFKKALHQQRLGARSPSCAQTRIAPKRRRNG